MTVRQRLKKWFSLPLGQHLLDREQEILEKIIPDLFGYHLMQLGSLDGDRLIRSTRITHSFIVQVDEEGDIQQGSSLQTAADNLPIASDSIDVVVLPHVLEFAVNPHKILREIERVLIGEGHLIIIGFNPWSLFGLWRMMLAWRGEPPWCGYFFGFNRIRDWCTLLDLELIRLERFFYRPPLKNIKVLGRFEFLEKLGNYCWPAFGGIYIIVVQKRVVPLTPVKDMWSKRRSMIKSGIAEPTTRNTGR